MTTDTLKTVQALGWRIERTQLEGELSIVPPLTRNADGHLIQPRGICVAEWSTTHDSRVLYALARAVLAAADDCPCVCACTVRPPNCRLNVPQSALIAQMQQEPNFEQMLGDLLAVIHRDGGHYVAEYGWQKTAEDARAAVVNWHAQCDASSIDAAMAAPAAATWAAHEDCGMRHPEACDLTGGETDASTSPAARCDYPTCDQACGDAKGYCHKRCASTPPADNKENGNG